MVVEGKRKMTTYCLAMAIGDNRDTHIVEYYRYKKDREGRISYLKKIFPNLKLHESQMKGNVILDRVIFPKNSRVIFTGELKEFSNAEILKYLL